MKNQLFWVPCNPVNSVNLVILVMLVVILVIYVTRVIFTSPTWDTNNGDDGKTITENFDTKIADTSKAVCGIYCTNIYGCAGFGHKNDGSCYLSKTPILSKPVDSVYTDDYSVGDYRCNKLQPLYKVDDITVPEAYKKNALYNCAENEEGEFVLELISEFKTEPIYDFDDVYALDVPQYALKDYQWPITRNEVVDKRSKRKDYLVYEKSGDEYLGQYLYPHKCIDNIPEDACLKICSFDENCVGVEWNPYYVKEEGDNVFKIYQNICCPKKQIQTVIPRRKEFENGRFYLKTYQDKLNTGIPYVTFR